jgi:CRP/FNR family transcriptional regulator
MAAPTRSEHRSIEERLASFPLLADVDVPIRTLLIGGMRSVRFDADTHLVGPRDRVTHVPLVERGAIRVERADPSGRRIALYRVGPGESCVLALAGALRGGLYPAEAVAEAGTEVLLVDAATLATAFERGPGLQQYVLDLFSARLFELMHLVREVAFERLDVRLARLLLEEASAGSGLWKPIALSHAELAARLGSAREVVTRLLQRLRDAGLVELARGRITVLDPDALARWGESPA